MRQRRIELLAPVSLGHDLLGEFAERGDDFGGGELQVRVAPHESLDALTEGGTPDNVGRRRRLDA